MPRPTPAFAAILVVLFGIFLMDVMGVLIRILSDRYPPQELAIFRNLFGLIPIFIVLARLARQQGRPMTLRLRQWKLGILRGLFITMAQISYYVALTKLEFATVSTLAFSAPMIVTALSVPILGDRVGPWRWTAVLMGFAGVVWVMQPGGSAFDIWAFLPVVAAFGYATVSVTSRLADPEVPSALLNFYATVTAMIGALIVTLAVEQPVMIGSWSDLGLILAMGLVGGIGGLFLTTGYRMALPSVLAPFEYSGLIFAFALGWLVFNEAPFERLFPGVLLIVGAGLLIAWREKTRGPAAPYPRASKRLR